MSTRGFRKWETDVLDEIQVYQCLSVSESTDFRRIHAMIRDTDLRDRLNIRYDIWEGLFIPDEEGVRFGYAVLDPLRLYELSRVLMNSNAL